MTESILKEWSGWDSTFTGYNKMIDEITMTINSLKETKTNLNLEIVLVPPEHQGLFTDNNAVTKKHIDLIDSQLKRFETIITKTKKLLDLSVEDKDTLLQIYKICGWPSPVTFAAKQIWYYEYMLSKLPPIINDARLSADMKKNNHEDYN